MDNHDSEDYLDRLLYELPGPPPPNDLAARIILRVEMQRRRTAMLRAALSSALALVGIWALLPALGSWLAQLALPANGLPVLMEGLDMAVAGAAQELGGTLSGLLSLQQDVYSLVSAAWPGLVALGLSALLAADLLLPRTES
jgi:hypothetical protein